MTENHKTREHSYAHVVFGILCMMVTLATAALTGVFLLLVWPLGYEFTTDWIPVWVVTLGTGFCLLGLACFLWWKKWARIGLLAACLLYTSKESAAENRDTGRIHMDLY